MTNDADSVVLKFMAAECEHLRALSSDYAKETAAIERYALTVAGAVWSWCAVHPSTPGVKVLFLAPIFTTFLFGIRAYSIYQARDQIRTYLAKKTAALVAPPEIIGWEAYAEDKVRPLRVRTAYIFWHTLEATSVLVALAASIWMP